MHSKYLTPDAEYLTQVPEHPTHDTPKGSYRLVQTVVKKSVVYQWIFSGQWYTSVRSVATRGREVVFHCIS